MRKRLRISAHPVITDDEIQAVTEVLQSGRLSGFIGHKGSSILGSEQSFYGGIKVRQFEKEFAEYFGVKHAVTFNSGTSALHAACIACGIGPDDEVIAPPFTFTASVSCVLMSGARPVFADVQEDIFNIDPLEVEKAVTPKTRAIIPVHLCGHPADMTPVMNIAKKYKLNVIEDAAQAIGTKYKGHYVGTIGDCGVFSFQETKTITTGEGGMLITNDNRIAEIACAVRNHGEVLEGNILGWDYRMTEMTAALGIVQLRKLDFLNSWRIRLCNHLTERLSGIEGLTPPVVYPDCVHTYYTYAFKIDEDKSGLSRHSLLQKLNKKGIYCGDGYIKPLHLLPIYGGKRGDYPVAEKLYEKELAATCICRYPATIEDMDYIADTIVEILKK